MLPLLALMIGMYITTRMIDLLFRRPGERARS
jgi:hypothetical protein